MARSLTRSCVYIWFVHPDDCVLSFAKLGKNYAILNFPFVFSEGVAVSQIHSLICLFDFKVTIQFSIQTFSNEQWLLYHCLIPASGFVKSYIWWWFYALTTVNNTTRVQLKLKILEWTHPSRWRWAVKILEDSLTFNFNDQKRLTYFDWLSMKKWNQEDPSQFCIKCCSAVVAELSVFFLFCLLNLWELLVERDRLSWR